MLMSLVENINKRKKAGTSRPKSKSSVSPKAYAKMKSGYRGGGMTNQMSDQMGISTERAGGLMKKYPANQMKIANIGLNTDD